MFNDEDTADEVLESLTETEGQDSVDKMMNEAMQRIEEANLFKTLIKTPIFGQNSASPEIIESVQKKITEFARKELAVLLGIVPANHYQVQPQVKSPFDEEEVEALKGLAARVLKRVPTPVPERTPQIMQIKTVDNSKLVGEPPKAPAKSQKKKGLPKSPDRLAMPTVEQMVAAFGAPSAMLTDEKGNVVSGQGSTLSDLINGASGGQLIHVDNTNPADVAGEGDVNDRF